MERYETCTRLACGRHTTVYLARDMQADGALVAIKVFQQAHCMPQVLKSAIREAKLLRELGSHPHIVTLHHSLRSESRRVYLIMEYLPRPLFALMPSSGAGMQLDTVLRVSHQLLSAIHFLHRHKVIHRDLKPSSLMLNEAGSLKLVNFDCAREDRPQDRLTPYVVPRWYRAPEVLVGLPYGAEVDIWAAGCIIAEMATGQPLFPGSSHIDQLQLLIDCFGTLPSLLMSACGDMLRKQLLSVPDQGDAGGLQARLRKVPEVLYNLIELCLHPDPLERPGAGELLALPCFAHLAAVAVSEAAACKPVPASRCQSLQTCDPTSVAMAPADSGATAAPQAPLQLQDTAEIFSASRGVDAAAGSSFSVDHSGVLGRGAEAQAAVPSGSVASPEPGRQHSLALEDGDSSFPSAAIPASPAAAAAANSHGNVGRANSMQAAGTTALHTQESDSLDAFTPFSSEALSAFLNAAGRSETTVEDFNAEQSPPKPFMARCPEGTPRRWGPGNGAARTLSPTRRLGGAGASRAAVTAAGVGPAAATAAIAATATLSHLQRAVSSSCSQAAAPMSRRNTTDSLIGMLGQDSSSSTPRSDRAGDATSAARMRTLDMLQAHLHKQLTRPQTSGPSPKHSHSAPLHPVPPPGTPAESCGDLQVSTARPASFTAWRPTVRVFPRAYATSKDLRRNVRGSLEIPAGRMALVSDLQRKASTPADLSPKPSVNQSSLQPGAPLQATSHRHSGVMVEAAASLGAAPASARGQRFQWAAKLTGNQPQISRGSGLRSSLELVAELVTSTTAGLCVTENGSAHSTAAAADTTAATFTVSEPSTLALGVMRSSHSLMAGGDADAAVPTVSSTFAHISCPLPDASFQAGTVPVGSVATTKEGVSVAGDAPGLCLVPPALPPPPRVVYANEVFTPATGMAAGPGAGSGYGRYGLDQGIGTGTGAGRAQVGVAGHQPRQEEAWMGWRGRLVHRRGQMSAVSTAISADEGLLRKQKVADTAAVMAAARLQGGLRS